jgi:hypothetical protein
MTLEKQRLNITDRVVGKFSNGQINLFLENEQIGQMVSKGAESSFDLKTNYQYEDNSFYQYVDVPTKQDEKYVDCDDVNGWC